MPFACSICEEESTRICVICTKDTCSNHLCEKCGCCSDCCECDIPLSEPLAGAPTVHAEPRTPNPDPEPLAGAPTVHAEPPTPNPDPEPEPPHPPPDPDPLPMPEDEPEPGAPV